MSFPGAEFREHIRDEVDYLEEHSAQLTAETFSKNETLRRAFVRSLEIIGEASKKLQSEVKDEIGDVDWRAVAGMRDRLIHGYFGVDYELVWDVVVNKVPHLGRRVREYLDERE